MICRRQHTVFCGAAIEEYPSAWQRRRQRWPERAAMRRLWLANAKWEMRETLSSSSSTIETKRVSQTLSAAITHNANRAEQNTWHLPTATPESNRKCDRERDSKRAQEWPQQLRSTKSDDKESALALLLSCFTVPCALRAPAVSLARNSCIASRQILAICRTALALEVLRSLSHWKAKTSCRCLWIFQQQELRIIIRNFNSNSVFAFDSFYREFDSIRFHCQIIGEIANLFLQN